jgi:uncharacterized protein involved in response to NO
MFAGANEVSTALRPTAWHVHESVYGYGAAARAGFMLTAIANGTGGCR